MNEIETQTRYAKIGIVLSILFFGALEFGLYCTTGSIAIVLVFFTTYIIITVSGLAIYLSSIGSDWDVK
jgi:uncharacterized membrane protein YccC